VTVSPLEVFAGPTAALPAAVFLSIVVIAVCNFRFIKGSSLCAFSGVPFCFLGFRFLVLNVRSILWFCRYI